MKKNFLIVSVLSLLFIMNDPVDPLLISHASELAETYIQSDEMVKNIANTDEDGNVTLDVELADDIDTPLNVTLSRDGNNYKFTINKSGDPLKIQPGTYKVKKVVDGNGKKLDKGAILSIDEDSTDIYLDFKDPNKDERLSIIHLLIRNIIFIPLFVTCVFFVKSVVSHVEA